MPPGLQASRFEMKYLVDERTAVALRDFARAHLEPDAHAEDPAQASYRVSSLYFDSADLCLYRASQDGVRDRFKLRIRWYGASPSAAHFEIKRRVDKVVLKERAAVSWAAAQELIDGRPPRPDDVRTGDPRAFPALDRFSRLRRSIDAEGRLVVAYSREAYFASNGTTVRLTFDRSVSGRVYRESLNSTNRSPAFHPRIGGVIVEMKFTDCFPAWMEEATQVFGLARRRIPKYVLCLKGTQTADFEVFRRKSLNGTAPSAADWGPTSPDFR